MNFRVPQKDENSLKSFATIMAFQEPFYSAAFAGYLNLQRRLVSNSNYCQRTEEFLIYITFFLSPFIVPPVLLQTISTLRSLLMACRKCIQ